jgi:hypothetical protein
MNYNLQAISCTATASNNIQHTTVIKEYGECLNNKNYSKRHIAINPPRFEHTYPIVLATF